MKSLIYLSNCLILISIFSSCCLFKDCDDEPSMPSTGGGSMVPICNGMNFCGQNPSIINNGLEITFLNHDLAVPVARYSVLFKVDQNGIPVTNLDISNIEVKDNNQVLNAESDNQLIPDPQSFGFDILLLVDLSESITDANALPTVKSAMTNFVETIIPSDITTNGEIRIGIYYFDGDPDILQLQSFTTDKQALLSAIDRIDKNLTRDTSTNLYGAFISGSMVITNALINSSKLANVGAMVVFTDGTDLAGLDSQQDAQLSVDALANNSSQTDIYTIGLGNGVDVNVLTSLGVNGFFFAQDLDNLIPTFKQIGDALFQEVNSYYKLEYCSPRRRDETSIEINVSRNNGQSTIRSCINSNCTPNAC